MGCEDHAGLRVCVFAAFVVGYGLGEQAQLGEQDVQTVTQEVRQTGDEVKAIILQAHPAPAPEKPAGIGDNRRES